MLIGQEFDLSHARKWLGKSERQTQLITVDPAIRMAATLGCERRDFKVGDILPTLWQWLYFLPQVANDDLNIDGHPKHQGILPPIPFPRRMWAAGDVRVYQTLHFGDLVIKESKVASIDMKTGRSGGLVFVKVIHNYFVESDGHSNEVLAISEEQDLVFRAHAAFKKNPSPELSDKASAGFSRTIIPSTVALFRFSALTFNSHRIHYDRDYAVNEEQYPALIVHGPLIACLLADLLSRECPEQIIGTFRFRAIAPAFDSQPLDLLGAKSDIENNYVLWSSDGSAAITMKATATVGLASLE